MVRWSEVPTSLWPDGPMVWWSDGQWTDGLTAHWSCGLIDCHGNTALAAFIHIISHVGSLQCNYCLSNDSYFIHVHALIFCCWLSIGHLVRLCYCRSHFPVYLSLSLCCSFRLPLLLLASLSVPLYASNFP